MVGGDEHIWIRGGKVGKVYKEGPFGPVCQSATIQIVVYSSDFSVNSQFLASSLLQIAIPEQ